MKVPPALRLKMRAREDLLPGRPDERIQRFYCAHSTYDCTSFAALVKGRSRCVGARERMLQGRRVLPCCGTAYSSYPAKIRSNRPAASPPSVSAIKTAKFMALIFEVRLRIARTWATSAGEQLSHRCG